MDSDVTDVFHTGLTEDDMRDELQLLDAGLDVRKQCYLCKRQGGANSVRLEFTEEDEDGADPRIATATIKLQTVTRELQGMTLHWPLCIECMTLLELESSGWYEVDR